MSHSPIVWNGWLDSTELSEVRLEKWTSTGWADEYCCPCKTLKDLCEYQDLLDCPGTPVKVRLTLEVLEDE